MTENINPELILKQLETQLAELVKTRDWLNERIRLIRESLDRLRKQAQVNEQLALDTASRALLILLADLTAGEVAESPQDETVVVAIPEPKPKSGGKLKSYGLVSLLQSVLATLAGDKIPESVSEALATAFGETWTEKGFSLFRGRHERVNVKVYLRGEVPEDFRRYLAEAFLKLRAVRLNQVPDGFAASDSLVKLAEKTTARWKQVEQVVVEKWLPNELAHLRKSK